MECRPVDAAVVAFENVLHDGIASAKQVGVHLRDTRDFLRGRDGLLAKACNVPDAHRLVERRGDDEVLLRVEGCARHAMVMSGESADARSALPVPDADRLVVGRGDDPRVLLVELHGSDVVEVPEQGEQAPTQLEAPQLDLVVVTSGNEQRLRSVEAHAANRPVVLVESVDERSHAEVPELHDAAVQGCEDPWSTRVERESLDAVRLGLRCVG